ncbi:MAG TPA: TonB-dependent siderophore receptor, partial [Pusillimonas sp.]|nr:TonB-dependent siderophore receptor [Pusillimonas sp.]
MTNPGDGTVSLDPTTNTYWLKRGTKSRWQKSTLLSNVSQLYGKFDTGNLKHSFNLGIELTRETNKNASYAVNTTSGSACPASAGFSSTDLDCTPYLNPNPYDPWTGSITRSALSQDATSTTRSIYAFDTIDLNERFQVSTG